MENNDLLYHPYEPAYQQKRETVSKYQAVKAMIFGLVALAVAELPYFIGLFVAPPFAIIALCMAADFKRKHPGHYTGFTKAAKATSIVALPLAVLVGILTIVSVFTFTAASYYM